MKITYIEKGEIRDFKRIETERTVILFNTWRYGGLLYGYRDRFNVMAISIEDIISIDK